MAPTIQDGEKSSRRENAGRISKSDFACQVKYGNALPDVPFDAKFITYPFESNRFIQYKSTSLERNYNHDLLTEPDLGVTIDLINPETYVSGHKADMDPLDERLLEEEISTVSDSKRARPPSKTVSWLRKTEYISTEYNRFQTSNEMAETKVGFNVKKQLQGTDLYKDRDAQINAVEASFEAAQTPVARHHANPRLKPVEELPVFPDFQYWGMPCAHVIFDTEPTTRGKNEAATFQEMSHAMVRGMQDDSGDQFVAYFLPTKDTLLKRKREADNADEELSETYDYKLAREYNWNVKNKASTGYEENYFAVFREGEGVFYNQLQTRVKLNKRRIRGGAGGITSSVSKLIVRTRDPTEQENRLQEARLSQLENVVHEEEDDEDDDEANSETGDKQSGDGKTNQVEANSDDNENSNAEKSDSDSDDLF